MMPEALDVGEGERLVSEATAKYVWPANKRPDLERAAKHWLWHNAPALLEAVRQQETETTTGDSSDRWSKLTDRLELAERQRDELREALQRACDDLDWHDWSLVKRADRLLLAAVMDMVRDRLETALNPQAPENPSHPNTEVEERA